MDLREIEGFPAEVVIEEEADNADYGVEGVSFRDIMTVKLNIQKVKDEYYAQGVVSVPVEEECSRCLNMFHEDLEGDLNFIIKTEAHGTKSAAKGSEDIVHVPVGKPVVELNDLIRQTLMLSIPMKPLCNEYCKGLCPSCGVNLNEETCDCEKEDIDDRWEGLKDLLE